MDNNIGIMGITQTLLIGHWWTQACIISYSDEVLCYLTLLNTKQKAVKAYYWKKLVIKLVVNVSMLTMSMLMLTLTIVVNIIVQREKLEIFSLNT